MQKLQLFTGGHKFRANDLIHMQNGTIEALNGVLQGLGRGKDAFIIEGCEFARFGPVTSITAGYIYYGGEIYPVAAQVLTETPTSGYAEKWKIVEEVILYPGYPDKPDPGTGDPYEVLYQDTTYHNVHIRLKMELAWTDLTGSEYILTSAIKRLRELIGIVPQQGIIMYSGDITNFETSGEVGKGKVGTPVEGFALCNGTTYTSPHGGSIVSPNLQGQFIVGYNSATGDYDTIGNTGGEESVELEEDNIPEHNHSVTVVGGSHNHPLPTSLYQSTGFNEISNAGNDIFVPMVSSGSPTAYNNTLAESVTHTHTATSGNFGKNPADKHENRPPYYVLAFIIKL